MTTPLNPSAGLALKAQHYEAASCCTAQDLWFEVHPENYMVDGGPRLAWLETISHRHPISLHGVSLSLAADARPDADHLQRLKALANRIQPALISEHLAWSAWRGQYHPDLLPFPRTVQALQRITDNIQRTQDVLQRPIAIENPSHYVHLAHHSYGEIEFLHALSQRTGCGLLLDINNVFLSAHNMGCDANAYVDAFPGSSLMEVHLAGHSADPGGASLLIDSHDAPVAEDVWTLYERLIRRIGPRPTLIERDDKLPPFDELLKERERAQSVLARHA